MDKDKERLGIIDLLNHLSNWCIVPRPREESPDFVIEHEKTKMRIGVEVTDYYPHRSRKGRALVKIPGDDEEERRKNELRYFEKTSFGYGRFVPKLDIEDLYENRIARKEQKLGQYRANEPECGEFWLLIMLNFYDDVIYEDAPPLTTSFDRIYMWEEPHRVFELPIDHIVNK